MKLHTSFWVLLSLLAVGCGDSATTPDAASDTTVIVDSGDVPSVPDRPDGSDAADASFPCPTESLAPVFSQSCAGFEGAACRYGYNVPGCGGRTQTCRGGRWNEEHTDPMSSCFDAGADRVDATPDSATDSATDSAADSATDAGNPCLAERGICVSDSASCTGGGGTVSAAGASGCVFSDGRGVCCVPPAPMPTGDSCASHGGVCAPISGCNFVQGAFAPPTCAGVGVVCCVPRSVCGPETQVCCAPGGSASFRPSCDRGAYRCTLDGTMLMPRDRCP